MAWHVAALLGGVACIFYAIKCIQTGKGPFQYIMVERSKNPILFWTGVAMFLFAAFFFILLGLHGIALFVNGK